MNPTLPPFDRSLWIGYFFAWSHQYGQNRASPPGNCTVIVDEPRCAQTSPWPIIAGIPCLDVMSETAARWAKIVAIYLSAEAAGSPVDMICRKRGMARQMMATLGVPRRPFVTYTGVTPAVELADGETWIGVQLYITGNQGPDEMRALAAKWKPSLVGLPVALICQAYNMNFTYTGDLAALQPLYPEIAQDYLASGIDVKAILWFSDGRPGGTREHEEIRPWHVATVEALP